MNMTEVSPSSLNHSERHRLTAMLLDGIKLEQQILALDLGRCTIHVHSNSLALLSKLHDYFSHIVRKPNLLTPDHKTNHHLRR
jgi:hypothetical protein